MTKEMWERSEPVNPQQQKDYRDFTKDINTYLRVKVMEAETTFVEAAEIDFSKTITAATQANPCVITAARIWCDGVCRCLAGRAHTRARLH